MRSLRFPMALVLALLAGIHLVLVTGQGPVRKNVSCNFEPSTRCDWHLPPEPHVGYNASVVRAAALARTGGPATDVDPGTAEGHYFYLSYDQPLLSEQLRILTIPSIKHKFTCSLSFSYFAVGPVELTVLQQNLVEHTIFVAQTTNISQARWEIAQVALNTSEEYSGVLAIETSNFDFGEALPDPEEDDVFLAIDDVVLTYCLPCDYDRLGDVGGITVDGVPPDGIDVGLRLVQHYQFNASAEVCPNETFIFTIESVQPSRVSPIFALDPETGLLAVDGRGPHLDANGTQGVLNISIHIASSNYSASSSIHKYIVTIPFRQPPTITHTAPSLLNVNVGDTISYSFSVMSSISRAIQLDLGRPEATPPELLDNVTITSTHDLSTVSVSILISISRVLPLIVLQGTPASLSIPIKDVTNGGVVFAQTQLPLLPSPPLFNQTVYEYSVQEGSGVRILGPFAMIDPNGDTFSTPETSNSPLFTVVPHQLPQSHDKVAYSYFDILAVVRLNYELQRSYSFTMTASDSANPMLSSEATVNVNVLPINEYSPVFRIARKELTISDVKPVGSNVTDFEATDRDEGADGQIDYTITDGNDDMFFGISGLGFGEVIVQRSPILPHTYTLTITAADRGTPSLSTNATLIVHVTATTDVDCTLNEFGPPDITSSGMILLKTSGNDVTMECQYSSNPIQRILKWQHMNTYIFPNTSDSHYTVTPHSLTIHNLTREDAGYYLCNVTNQCGSSELPFTMDIIDYPNAPSGFNFTREPDTSSIGVSWTPPSSSDAGFVTTPVDGYVIQTRIDSKAREFSDVMELGADATEANVTGLFPGTEYSIRVVSVNRAGRTPSNSVSFTTAADVPRLQYLQADGLANGSILLEWRLEYDGGHPIINFEIHVSTVGGRARREATPPDIVYYPDIATNRLVTRPVRQGQTFSILATASNILGASDPQTAHAFVGHTDTVSCGYDDSDDVRGCPWQLGQGRITAAQGATEMLPRSDADGNQFGHYISASLGPVVNESTLMSYRQAGYICGFSFSYYLSQGADLVVRSNPSRKEVWSTVDEAPPTTGSWNSVNYMKAQRYFTSDFEETLDIVLKAAAPGSGGGRNSTHVLMGAVDNLNVSFCLPCNFEGLLNETQFTLSYDNQIRIYLRETRNLTIQAVLEQCTQAVVNFTITRVVPSDLVSRFSMVTVSGQSATVQVGPITPLLALPHTIGFLEVTATVVHSDYLYESSSVERAALIEFVLLPTTQNCSFSDSCNFETTCSLWQLGADSAISDSSLPPSTSSTSGSYLYTSYPRGTIRTFQLASATINDSFCAISFLYVLSASLELQVIVGGLGSVWSSIEISPGTTGGKGEESWLQQTVEIDLQAVGVQPNRTLTFEISWAEGRSPVTSSEEFAALDNITLHPCIDCSAPECSFTTCFPGYYYSLTEENCVACPQGYYCPNWWGLPRPCPPGTYSNAFNAASKSACRPCSVDSFSVKQASTSCQSCPTGYSCSNASGIPVAIDNSCPTSPECQPTLRSNVANTSLSVNPVLIAVGSIGCAFLLLCVVSTCLLTCFCLRAKQRRNKKIKRQKQHRDFLLRDSVSIGTAGSLGSSTMTSASSTYDGRRGKRRLKKRGDASTLMSFLSDDDTTVGTDPYITESSWADTEQLTSSKRDPSKENTSFAMRNDGFDDVQLGDDDDDHYHGNELSDFNWRHHKSKSGRDTSLL